MPALRDVRTRRAIETVCVAAAVLVLTIAQLFRQTGVHSWDTVWAEDGKYFFNGTSHLGNLFDQQAGYLQLTGRLFGLGAHVVPIDDVAIFYAAGGALLTSLMAAAVWYFSEHLVTSRALRVVLALQVVVLPAMLLEQVANGVNAMWAVTYAGWWALVYRPRHTAGVVAASLVAVLAACSSSLVLTFIPLAAVLAWRRPGRYRIVAAAFAVGSAVQAIVTLGAPEVQSSTHHAGDLPGIFSIRVLGSMLVGEQWVGDVWSAIGWGLAVVAAAVTLAWITWLAVRGKGEPRLLGLVAVGYAVFLYFGELWVRGSVLMRIGSEYHSFGARYSSLSIWLLTAGLVLLVSSVSNARVVRFAVVVIVVWFAVTSIAGFRGTTPRSQGPGWKTSVQLGRQACRDGAAQVELQVVPYPFNITISCADLG